MASCETDGHIYNSIAKCVFCGTPKCEHPPEARRAQRPGAGEGLQPELCVQCGQEVSESRVGSVE